MRRGCETRDERAGRFDGVKDADEGMAGDGESKAGLWGGRFAGGMDASMAPLNRSLDLDARFWRQDVRGSRAWARALVRAGVISDDEGEAIDEGLSAVIGRLDEADFSELPDEDVHSLVERLLYEEIGALAGKLHTGRSRNDQVATDVRLWGMERAGEVDEALAELCEALVALADRSMDVLLPGYTHLQRAQPIRAAHWALSHFWAFAGDRDRIRRARGAAAILPLGSGALAGCPFSVDREFLRDTLGFREVSRNSLHAVADRDWMVDFVYAGATTGVHLSRLAEDLILYTSAEFGVFRLADGFSTGSSLMPQKRNPDVAELARGKAGRLTGNLVTLLTLLKGLPTSYNRDLQEDKPPLFDTVDTLATVLPPVAGAVASGRFLPDRAAELLDTQLLATDLADYLVRRGVPFRDSHDAVGWLVRKAEEEGCGLDELGRDVYAAAHPAFEDDVREVFSWERAVDARDVVGGTSRRALEEQMASARDRLAEQTASMKSG